MQRAEMAYLENLNPPQLEAVKHGNGPALVLAGPGSGKTTVIVKRILYLILEQEIPPDEILVITFTKDAAKSMQSRFRQQTDQIYPVNFGTFHSVFYHILLESNYFRSNFQDRNSQDRHSPNILTQTQKRSILLALLKAENAKREAYYDYDTLKTEVDDILRAISFYKNTQDMERAVRGLPSAWRQGFGRIFEDYQKQCRLQGGLDFDDMVYECRRLLEDDEGQRARWKKRFSYILIDEFQDINPMQYEVVKILAESHGNIFAVGDDDQAIYGFRGSSPACLKQFAEEFHARQILLNANYRSAAEIVTAAEKVIAENAERFEKKYYAAGKYADDEEHIHLRCFESRAQEFHFLRDHLARELSQDAPGESCGVLFRTNGSMQQFAALLARAGIPFEMRERTGNVYEHFIVRDIMCYLKLAAGARNRELLLRILNRPVRYLSRECVGECEQFDLQAMEQWYAQRKGAGDLRYIQEIRKLQTQLQAMKTMPLPLAIVYIIRAVDYGGYLRNRKEAGEHLEEWLDILDFLREEAREYENVSAWERAQKEWGNTDGTSGRDGRKRQAGREDSEGKNTDADRSGAEQKESPLLHLMTIHGAKGLEFDRVVIPDCNERVFPHGRMPDRETLEEERRIFYVGMTRAKKHLELLCTTGTKERPRVISRFLNPLSDLLAAVSTGNPANVQSSVSSINSSNSQLSRYSSKASTTFSYSSSSSIKPSSGSSLGSSGFSL